MRQTIQYLVRGSTFIVEDKFFEDDEPSNIHKDKFKLG